MTNEDMQQFSDLLEEKLDQKLEPIKQDINGLKKGQAKLEKSVSNLEKDVSSLKQGQVRLEKKIETEIESLAISTQNGFEELENNIKKEMFIQKLELESKVEQIGEEALKHKQEIINIVEPVMSELEDIRGEQTANIRLHDRIESDHLKLKAKVYTH